MPPKSPFEPPAPTLPPAVPPSPGPIVTPVNPEPQAQVYDFITHSDEPVGSHAGLSLPGGNSMAMRGLYAAGGLFVLVILIVIIKGVLGGSSNLSSFTIIIQDQQELIHLTSGAGLQQGQTMSVSNQNFAATAQLSFASSQTAIATYLTGNGYKLDPKTLNLEVSTSTDAQLTSSIAAGNYDQTFQQVMKTKIAAYMNDLQQTYKQTGGSRGHVLLNNDYKQAQLLLTQLSSATD